MAAKSGVTVPMLLKILGIAPPGGELEGDNLWVRNYGEQLPLRGSHWLNGAGAGVFALSIGALRMLSTAYAGFRAAFVNL